PPSRSSGTPEAPASAVALFYSGGEVSRFRKEEDGPDHERSRMAKAAHSIRRSTPQHTIKPPRARVKRRRPWLQPWHFLLTAAAGIDA
ncbi:MAG: hypothetical protein JW706_08955, partial [Opitutales bacterium]|nr:hypothetical protein [Opitutales bacterium]